MRTGFQSLKSSRNYWMQGFGGSFTTSKWFQRQGKCSTEFTPTRLELATACPHPPPDVAKNKCPGGQCPQGLPLQPNVTLVDQTSCRIRIFSAGICFCTCVLWTSSEGLIVMNDKNSNTLNYIGPIQKMLAISNAACSCEWTHKLLRNSNTKNEPLNYLHFTTLKINLLFICQHYLQPEAAPKPVTPYRWKWYQGK